ncbi:MAG: hypothetical protein ACJ74Q_04340 [Pyrinomonadaceae bacterium]
MRIAWLKGEVERAENQAAVARAAVEFERAMSMLNPRSTEDAYAWFGTFLGLFPPFAIFVCVVGGSSSGGRNLGGAALFWLALLFVMNAVCCVVGRKFGRLLGRLLGDPRALSWPMFLLVSLLVAGAWGVVTGGAGGAVAFGIGAIFGIVCAVTVALAAFPIFSVLHRAQSHGGMIEKGDLWPLALGIPLTAAALILSVWK